MISILILFFTINHIESQLTITGSASECGPRSNPLTCGRARVLRGQSHIGIPAACFLKVDPGPCSQDLIRIYYDSRTYTCKAFSYSGCGGNANRFVSVKNCYKLCHPYYRQRFVSLGPKGSSGIVTSPCDNEADNANAQSDVISVEDSSQTTTETEKSSEETTVATDLSTQETTEETKQESTAEDESTTTTTTDTSEITTEETTDINTSSETTTTTEEEEESTTLLANVRYFNNLPKDAINEPPMKVIHESDQFVLEPQRLSKNGYLSNVQHQNYYPIGGYLKTKQGYLPQPQLKQTTYLTNYG